MKVALVNTNRVRPPIAPIGLEYVAEALVAAGHEVEILDLTWAVDKVMAIDDFFNRCDPPLIGITLRNTDDCAFTTRHSFLPDFAALVQHIRRRSRGFIVVGGVGFSVMPKEVLAFVDADAGIRGEGEFALPLLASRYEHGEPITDIPGLVMRAPGGGWIDNPVRFGDLTCLPVMGRRFFDNRRYFHEGGQAAVETKRGCHLPCTFCADPPAKGRTVRLRPPRAVVDEIEALLSQGVDCFHTADSEFNLQTDHALHVCDEMIARGLGDKVTWYAYCTPKPFSRETAERMRRAGCAGINFSVDHGDPDMLKRLGRNFSPRDILDTAEYCAKAGIAVMFDLLLGAPGESRASVTNAVTLMKQSKADRIGVSLGLRVWPGTEIAEMLGAHPPPAGLSGGEDVTQPLYYLEPAVAEEVASWIATGIDGDPRFLFFNPEDAAKNYNYNDNQVLQDAVLKGHRGAYWDILRRLDS